MVWGGKKETISLDCENIAADKVRRAVTEEKEDGKKRDRAKQVLWGRGKSGSIGKSSETFSRDEEKKGEKEPISFYDLVEKERGENVPDGQVLFELANDAVRVEEEGKGKEKRRRDRFIAHGGKRKSSTASAAFFKPARQHVVLEGRRGKKKKKKKKEGSELFVISVVGGGGGRELVNKIILSFLCDPQKKERGEVKKEGKGGEKGGRDIALCCLYQEIGKRRQHRPGVSTEAWGLDCKTERNQLKERKKKKKKKRRMMTLISFEGERSNISRPTPTPSSVGTPVRCGKKGKKDTKREKKKKREREENDWFQLTRTASTAHEGKEQKKGKSQDSKLLFFTP